MAWAYRFMTADEATQGRWRKTFGKALIDAVRHLKGWDRPARGLVIDIDARVALTFLDDLKAAGYRFQKVRRA